MTTKYQQCNANEKSQFEIVFHFNKGYEIQNLQTELIKETIIVQYQMNYCNNITNHCYININIIFYLLQFLIFKFKNNKQSLMNTFQSKYAHNHISDQVNFTTLKSQQPTVHNTLNFDSIQYNNQKCSNDQICNSDRSNSNIFNLSSHDSQSFINSPQKIKQTFGRNQELTKNNNLQKIKNQQNNVFISLNSPQNAYDKQSISSQVRLKNENNKYQQFALKISKLFNVKFDNLQNLYSLIKQQISDKRKEQSLNQQQNSIQQSDIMKRLFVYAMKIKSGHNTLKNIIQVIDRKTFSVKDHNIQQVNISHSLQNQDHTHKYFNNLQENISMKVQEDQKTKRHSINKMVKLESQKQFYSQNYLMKQKLDSIQTINTIANIKVDNQKINFKKNQFQHSNNKSSRKSRYSQKLHLIAQQLQMIKNQIQSQDDSQISYHKRVKNQQEQTEIVFQFNPSLIYNEQNLNSSINNQINVLNNLDKRKQQIWQKNQTMYRFQESFPKYIINTTNNSINQNAYFGNQNMIYDQDKVQTSQKLIQSRLPAHQTRNLMAKAQNMIVEQQSKFKEQKQLINGRQQKSYTYINSLEQLPQQQDQLSQIIHQAVIKSIRSPNTKKDSSSFNQIPKSLNNSFNNENPSQIISQNYIVQKQKQFDQQYKKFLVKKQPFTFSPEKINLKKNNQTIIQKQQNKNIKNKLFFKSKDKMKSGKALNQIYLPEKQINQQQYRKNEQNQTQLNKNSQKNRKTTKFSFKKLSNDKILLNQSNFKVISPQKQVSFNQNYGTNRHMARDFVQQSKQKRKAQSFKSQSMSSIQTIPSVHYIQVNQQIQRYHKQAQINQKSISSGIRHNSLLQNRPKSAQNRNPIQIKPYKFGNMQQIQHNINSSPKKVITFNKDHLNTIQRNNKFNYQQNRRTPQKYYNNNSYSQIIDRANENMYGKIRRQSPVIYKHVQTPNLIFREMLPIKSDNTISNQNSRVSILSLSPSKKQSLKSPKQNNNFYVQPTKLNLSCLLQQTPTNVKMSNQFNTQNHSKQSQKSLNSVSRVVSVPHKQIINNTHKQIINNPNNSFYIPANFRPPKYVAPKIIEYKKQGQQKKDLSLSKEKRYQRLNEFQSQIKMLQLSKNNQQDSKRPIKTYTQGHLIEKSIKLNHQTQNQSLQKLASQRQLAQSKISRNKLLESQIQYRHDLMQKSTPSFGIQSSYQIISKSQFPLSKQISNSKGKNSRKGLSLSKKQKMYSSNYA